MSFLKTTLNPVYNRREKQGTTEKETLLTAEESMYLIDREISI